MGVFQFFIPPRSIPAMKREGFGIVMRQEGEKVSISVTFDEEPEGMLSRQLGMLDESQQAHVAIIIGILRHGGKVAIDGEVFNMKFRCQKKEEGPDWTGITTI